VSWPSLTLNIFTMFIPYMYLASPPFKAQYLNILIQEWSKLLLYI
jgi:hypothetical protein